MKTPFTEATEAVFIEALKSHSRKAFNELYDRYATSLVGIITRIVRNQDEAEDVLQETFVKVWRHIHRHDPAKGRLFTWLANVARNTALDHVRSVKNAQKVEFEAEMGAMTWTDIARIGFRDTVSTTLEAKYWQMIELIYFQGYTHTEVSDLLTMPLGTVKTRTRLALGELKSAFIPEYQSLHA